MNWSALKYLGVYITPIVVGSSLYLGGVGSYLALVFLFGFIPFIELFTSGATQNMDKMEEEIAKQDSFYDYLIYSLVPIQYFLLIFFLFQISSPDLLLFEQVGMTVAYGLAAGVIGINCAHELGHRTTWHEQLMSKMLLLSSLYMHFFIEHNRGHHNRVATDEDPASSRMGETVYAFYIRSIRDSWLSAWELEGQKLRKQQKKFWSWNNEMLRFQLIQLGLLVMIGLAFGLSTMLWFIGGATIGFLLLETVNYIEHYGLRREKKASGRGYERTLPIHSWNSNHPVGRLLLFELSRHSDHHYMANRKYQILRHFEESPQMPTGYPGMMLLSLVPPLWFKVMHQQIENFSNGQAPALVSSSPG